MIDKIIKRTGISAIILAILPLLYLVNCWRWSPPENYNWLKILYNNTQTVSYPWCLLTSILLLGWFIWCLRLDMKSAFVLAILLASSLVIGQILKEIIKSHVQEERPFMIWLYKQKNIDKIEFCSIHREIKNHSLAEGDIINNHFIPNWIRNYWCHEKKFSFPSGHTIFAAIWALLAAGILWPLRCFFSSIIIITWAIGVITSRMTLGMHWPLDIIIGVVIAWIIATITCWLIKYYLNIYY